MTPRKEIFDITRQVLEQITQLELIDLYRNQFGGAKETYPQYWTAALIKVNNIQWEDMVNQRQEGTVTVDIYLYTKDGWLDQHNTTADAQNGLIEINLIDEIVNKLQSQQGTQFKPLQQTDDVIEDNSLEGIMSYRLSFETNVYKQVNYPYTNRKITISS
ncbi:hypothetical protein R1T16_17435 [Flavobacterium sp. DG1-102-2]|uniref:hypothetical protein n=1 Tax=Flavobacterium sp. DG1-102-2 TaxID=3081663 RepID=UPI0029499867|nr:hypothetical protein [Flavobacterium sp. DG1-102-2]MDV6170223.1 hypothetical protein [Flavobacterium sp. DG1-102-2]